MNRTRLVLVVALLAAAGAAAAGLVAWRAEGAMGGLPDELRDRGTIARVGDGDLGSIRAEGARIAPVSRFPGLAAALEGYDPEAVPRAMRDAGVAAILVGRDRPGVDAPDAPIADRMRAFAHVPFLRAVRLAPAGAIYEVDPNLDLSEAERDALARIARAIVGGERPPPLSAFPPALRATRSVEVMVLLRENGSPRLWRSARGSSIGRSLVTAATVARERWTERAQAMGGPLDEMLPRLDVEVSLLLEDGTLGVRDRAFVEQAFTSAHGVAYEQRSSWRYLLPAATREAGGGSAVRAYEHLFALNGQPPETLASENVRLYRLVVSPLSSSPAPASSRRSSDVLPLGAGGSPSPID